MEIIIKILIIFELLLLFLRLLLGKASLKAAIKLTQRMMKVHIRKIGKKGKDKNLLKEAIL